MKPRATVTVFPLDRWQRSTVHQAPVWYLCQTCLAQGLHVHFGARTDDAAKAELAKHMQADHWPQGAA